MNDQLMANGYTIRSIPEGYDIIDIQGFRVDLAWTYEAAVDKALGYGMPMTLNDLKMELAL